MPTSRPSSPLLPTAADLAAAEPIVYRHLAPTPQIAWPLLRAATGVDLIVKHENHQRTGAFKARGGLVFLDRLTRTAADLKGVVSATRGNHGQSIAMASALYGVPCAILVPEGNSREKNAAMRGFGAEVIEAGRDFDAARGHAAALAAERGYVMVPSFHPDLVAGVATYGLELLRAVPDLDAILAPIGLGSGVCGLVAARDALRSRTEIWGVVAETADAYARSFAAGSVVETDSAVTFADGMAVRVPSPDALAVMTAGLAGVLRVDDPTIAAAMRLYFSATHNVAEGAGAAGLAAVMAEPERWRGKKVAVVLSGGNVDTAWYAEVLSGGTPRP
jgi:threonine dehydratase